MMKVGISVSEPSSSGQRSTACGSGRVSMMPSTAKPASPNALTVAASGRRQNR